MSYHLAASAPAIDAPVIGPTHTSTSHADSTRSSNSDGDSTEETPLLSALTPFDPQLDGFQINTNDNVSLKSGDLESGSLAQVEEDVGVGTRLSSIFGRFWRWILKIFRCCGHVANSITDNEPEGDDNVEEERGYGVGYEATDQRRG
ncbi:hypothetical protein L873DRAFT_1792997 [Choiromyces venosus 120613-1]|uniref:Uncharacterized protein n=1 Tax=Choiromyces venosus 120613-1 TaxID=1336337 RepID=A0A3N4J7R1_9PEZI|nr:hypothetical protein L873DRAFT_1792997 [Choiromyces venosus 120613-1]